VEPADSDAASPPVRKASCVPGGALWPSWRRRTKNRFGSRTEDFTDTRIRPLDSGGKVEAIGRGGATVVVFASGARAGTTEGRRSAAVATGGAEGGWLAMGGALAGAGAVLSGAAGMLAEGGGALLSAGMVPEVPVEAGGGIGAGALLCRTEGGGGGVALGRAEGGGGGLDRAARGGCGRASGGRE
jgi:hypothetical protein